MMGAGGIQCTWVTGDRESNSYNTNESYVIASLGPHMWQKCRAWVWEKASAQVWLNRGARVWLNHAARVWLNPGAWVWLKCSVWVWQKHGGWVWLNCGAWVYQTCLFSLFQNWPKTRGVYRGTKHRHRGLPKSGTVIFIYQNWIPTSLKSRR